MVTVKRMKNELEVVLSVLAYSACSGSLVLVNKLILHYLNYPSLVIVVQLVATLGFIYAAKYSKLLVVDGLVWEYIVPYLYYIVVFSLCCYCNMKSLAMSNVETVIVFRSLSPVLVAWADAVFLGRQWPSPRSWASLISIVVGAYGYASFDEQFKTQGIEAYAWPTVYLILIAIEMAYAKKIVRGVPLQTLSGPVLYTNLFGIPPMLLFAAMDHEFKDFSEQVLGPDPTVHITPIVIFLVILGCVAGTAIGYSAWWCRDKVSATSFTLIGVINKFLTIIVNYMIWDQHAKPAGIGFLLICLVGGTFYQQAPMREDANESAYSKVSTEESNGIEVPSASSENGGDDDDVEGGKESRP